MESRLLLTTIAAQSFDGGAGDTWSFASVNGNDGTPVPPYVGADVWGPVSSLPGITAASDGSTFWGINDLVNNNGGGPFPHSLDFAPIDVSGFSDVVLSFDYYTDSFGISDKMRYVVEFDNGTNWDNLVSLEKNTLSWTHVTVNVPVGTNFVRLRIQALQNGDDKYGGWDHVSLDGNVAASNSVQIIQSGGSTDLTEGGGADTVDVVLDGAPTQNVVVTLTPSNNQIDLGSGIGRPRVLTFTPGNANTPQTVSIIAIDDSAIEGLHTSLVSSVTASTDANFDGLSAPDVTVNITDNDLPNVVIDEILNGPAAVADANGEWLELFNAGSAPVDVNHWQISDAETDSHIIDNGGPLVIPAGGYLVLGIHSDFATNGGVAVDYQYQNFALGNTKDSIILKDAAGAQIDRVDYDGSKTFPNSNGASMALTNLALDNNVGSNWITSTQPFGDGDLGTPGAPNFSGPVQITLDNETSYGVAFSGTWGTSSGVPQFEGTSYRYTHPGGSRATYTPTLPTGGEYEVLVNYASHALRASNARYEIRHADGTTIVTLDQRTGGGVFQSLGRFNFVGGTGGSLVVSAQGADQFVVADAVRFVRVGNVSTAPTVDLADPTDGGSILQATLNGRNYLDVTFTDNSSSGLDDSSITDAGAEFTLSGPGAVGVTVNGTATLVNGTTYRYATSGAFSPGEVNVSFLAGSFADQNAGTNLADVESFTVDDGAVEVVVDNNAAANAGFWRTSGTVAGFVGSNYEYADAGGSGVKTYTPLLPQAGQYEVFVNYTSGSTRTSTARFEVNHRDGTTIQHVDQRTGGGSWVSIGTYNFDIGVTGAVTLRATEGDGFVIADAVKFVRLGVTTTTPTARLAGPAGGDSIGATTINGNGYVDVTFDVSHSGPLDDGSVTDAAAELALSGAGAAGVTVGGVGVMQAGTTYRYSFTGHFVPGPVSVTFLNDSFSDTSLVGNSLTVETFNVADDSIVEDVIVDNTDAAFSTGGDAWFASTSQSGFIGSNYLGSAVGTTNTATWAPTTLNGGTYEVFVRSNPHPQRATNAAYTVNHDGGSTMVVIDQTVSGSQWISLGTFAFTAGTGSVMLDATTANNWLVADAVRWVRTT